MTYTGSVTLLVCARLLTVGGQTTFGGFRPRLQRRELLAFRIQRAGLCVDPILRRCGHRSPLLHVQSVGCRLHEPANHGGIRAVIMVIPGARNHIYLVATRAVEKIGKPETFALNSGYSFEGLTNSVVWSICRRITMFVRML